MNLIVWTMIKCGFFPQMQSGKVTTLEVLLLFAFMVQLITAQLVPFQSSFDHNEEVMKSVNCEYLVLEDLP